MYKLNTKQLKMRGRKKDEFIKKQYRNIQELAFRFMESESAGAYIGRALLAAIALAGILAIAAITPNIFSAFGRVRKFNHTSYNEKQIRRSFYYLRSKKLVRIIDGKDGISKVKINRLGLSKLKEFAIDAMSIRIPEKWDGKWRAVVFDVPEKHKAARESLRRKLKGLGFYQFQRSIFLHPFAIDDEVLFIASFFGIERFIEIFTIENMLDDKPLKSHFNI